MGLIFESFLRSWDGVLVTLVFLGIPKGGRVEKVAEKVVLGSSPGTPFGVQIDRELKKVVPRSTLERTVRIPCAK